MAAPFSANNPQIIINNAQVKITALRNALVEIQNFERWLAQYAQADLVTAGMAAGDAAAIFNAMADANEIAGLYFGGALTGSYTIPFNFSASQATVAGPLS